MLWEVIIDSEALYHWMGFFQKCWYNCRVRLLSYSLLSWLHCMCYGAGSSEVLWEWEGLTHRTVLLLCFHAFWLVLLRVMQLYEAYIAGGSEEFTYRVKIQGRARFFSPLSWETLHYHLMKKLNFFDRLFPLKWKQKFTTMFWKINKSGFINIPTMNFWIIQREMFSFE